MESGVYAEGEDTDPKRFGETIDFYPQILRFWTTVVFSSLTVTALASSIGTIKMPNGCPALVGGNGEHNQYRPRRGLIVVGKSPPLS